MRIQFLLYSEEFLLESLVLMQMLDICTCSVAL